MIKGTILYIIALYLLGQAVSKLMEEQHQDGYERGKIHGFYEGRQAEIKLRERVDKVLTNDVHRES